MIRANLAANFPETIAGGFAAQVVALALGHIPNPDPEVPLLTRWLLPLGAALLLAPGPLRAQADDQEALIAKRDKKLQEAFLKNASWILDYDKARAEAKRSGKPIFAYFTRSYSP